MNITQKLKHYTSFKMFIECTNRSFNYFMIFLINWIVRIHLLNGILFFFVHHKHLHIAFLVIKLITFPFHTKDIVTSKKMSPFIEAYACARKTKKLLCCCNSPAVIVLRISTVQC